MTYWQTAVKRIDVYLPSKIYKAGDVIEGQCCVEIGKDIDKRARRVEIILKNHVKVSFCRRQRHRFCWLQAGSMFFYAPAVNPYKKGEANLIEQYKAKGKLFDDIVLVLMPDKCDYFEAGVHTLPFRIQIPNTALSSYSNFYEKYCYNHYYVTAEIKADEDDNLPNPQHSVMIHVVSDQVVKEGGHPSDHSITENVKLGLRASIPVTLRMNLLKTAFQAGEWFTMKVTASLQQPDNDIWHKTELSIFLVLNECFATANAKEKQYVVYELGHANEIAVHDVSNIKYEVQCRIPENLFCESANYADGLIDISFQLKAQLMFNGDSSPIVVEQPVTILRKGDAFTLLDESFAYQAGPRAVDQSEDLPGQYQALFK